MGEGRSPPPHLLPGAPELSMQGVKRANKSNAIDLYVSGEIAAATAEERKDWEAYFEEVPALLTPQV